MARVSMVPQPLPGRSSKATRRRTPTERPGDRMLAHPLARTALAACLLLPAGVLPAQQDLVAKVETILAQADAAPLARVFELGNQAADESVDANTDPLADAIAKSAAKL